MNDLERQELLMMKQKYRTLLKMSQCNVAALLKLDCLIDYLSGLNSLDDKTKGDLKYFINQISGLLVGNFSDL